MPVRKILIFPDPRLNAAAAPVTSFDAALRQLADDLLDTMRAAPGVGITAPHVGVFQRVVVMDLDDGAGVRVYVNPRVLSSSRETARHQEGSVSMPGVADEVERPAKVRVAWQDLDGAGHEADFEGFVSICLQHEIDQLDGIFWIRRLSKLRRDRTVKRFDKLVRTQRLND